MIDTSNRKVRPNTELNKLVDFSSLQLADPVIHPNGDVEQTVEYMKNIVKDNYKTVQKVADKLYNPRLNRFLRNIFDFVMTYVKYEKDSAFMEQLRVPLRTIKDQRGDCDCMAVLIGSILYAKNIPFSFRIAKYNGKSEFQHVYVIVSNNNGGYTVVDPVILTFDKEKPFDEKKDFYVDSRLAGFLGLSGMPIQLLNGQEQPLPGGYFGLYGDVMQVAMATDLMGFGLGDVEDDEAAMYRYLVRTRDVILAKPEMFKILKNPREVARMLDFAIRYWDTPNRENALGILEREEQRLLQDGTIVYPFADLTGTDLGELGKGFFKKVGSAIKNTAKKVGSGVKKAVKATGKAVATSAKAVAKGVAKGAKAVGKGVATAAKAVAKVVAKFNPVSLAARGGLLLAIRKNLFKLADKLQYGLYSEEQAKAAGLNIDDFRKMRESYDKARKIFVNTLQGKESKFQDAIRKGVKKKAINGLGELDGLGAAAATLIAAALGFITSIVKFFTGKKNPQTGETIEDENVTEGQVANLMNEAEMYDEDGNLISQVNTTATPDAEPETFWQKAGNIVSSAANVVQSYLPSSNSYIPASNPASYSTDEDYENDDDMAETQQTQKQSTGVTTTVMPGSMMNNVLSSLKKNALLIGVLGAVGIGAIVYFNRNKKKQPVSGIPGLPRAKPRKLTHPPRKLKALKLQ